MKQYIDKNEVLKEIENLRSSLFPDFYEYNNDAANVELLDNIKRFIESLEVKEINGSNR